MKREQVTFEILDDQLKMVERKIRKLNRSPGAHPEELASLRIQKKEITSRIDIMARMVQVNQHD